VVGSCEHGNEYFGFVRGRNLFCPAGGLSFSSRPSLQVVIMLHNIGS
jgi:hypothetical protein